jgi:hypothetical protein
LNPPLSLVGDLYDASPNVLIRFDSYRAHAGKQEFLRAATNYGATVAFPPVRFAQAFFAATDFFALTAFAKRVGADFLPASFIRIAQSSFGC